MRKEVIICDGCEKQKEQSNHWFTHSLVDGQFWISKGVEPERTVDPTHRHFCSQQCVTAAFQQWMDTEEK